MRDGHWIIDADRHVLEPPDIWKSYLPKQFRDRAPYLAPPPPETPEARIARLGPRGMFPPQHRWMMDGRDVMHKLSDRARIEVALASQRRAFELIAATIPEGQLASMDKAGIDISFLYPTYGLYFIGVDDTDAPFAAALARAYNDWLQAKRAESRRSRSVERAIRREQQQQYELRPRQECDKAYKS